MVVIFFTILTGNQGFTQTGRDVKDGKSPITNGTAGEQTPTRLFRAFWDDDYINYSGHGTDRAYTDGTRFELFYLKSKPSRFFVDKAMPKAGDSSINVFGWGLVQIMITPEDISNPNFQPNDYPWAGALFVSHTLYSYNEQKKYDLQTEIDGGVTGPAALAGPFQDAVHQMIKYKRPRGWDNQFGNAPWVDVKFAAEKQLAAFDRFVEVIGGAQATAGTAINGAAVYSSSASAK